MPIQPWETATVHAGGCEMDAEVRGGDQCPPFVDVTFENARVISDRRENGETTAHLAVMGRVDLHLDCDGARELIERLQAALRHPERARVEKVAS